MFDQEAEFVYPAPARVGGNVTMRWPTDQEWAVRSLARKFITRRLGRGKSEMITPKPGEADRKLYEAISLNGSPSLTPAECSMMLEALGVCQVTGVEVEGNAATVTMNVCSGEVKHSLRVPTAEEMLEYKQAAFKQLDLAHGQMQTTFSPEAGARLWDKCEGKSGEEYYKGKVPGTHKSEAVRVVIEHVENHMGPATDDPNS